MNQTEKEVKEPKKESSKFQGQREDKEREMASYADRTPVSRLSCASWSEREPKHKHYGNNWAWDLRSAKDYLHAH